MRNSFIFYRSFYEAIKELDDKEKISIYQAIFSLEFEDKEIELHGTSKAIFTLIKPQLLANDKRYENGKKGGRPKNQNETKTKPKQNQSETKAKPNENENVNVNENDNKKEIYKEKSFKKPTLQEVKNYCEERNNEIDPEKFIDFYESKDWYIGKNKMKDWKASVRTWEQRNRVKDVPYWFDKKIEGEEISEEDMKELESFLHGNYE